MSIFSQNIEEAAGAQLVNPLSEFYQKYINTLSPGFKISSCTYDGTRLSIKLDKDNSRTLHLGDIHNMFRDCLPDIKILDTPSFAFIVHQGYLDGQHMTVNCKSFKFDGISLKNMCVVSDQAAGWVFLDCLNLENVKFQAKCLEIMPFDDGDDRAPQMFYFPEGKNVVVSDNCSIYMTAANSVTFLRTLRCMLDLESFPIPEESMDNLYAYTYIQKSFDFAASNALPLNPGLRIMDALRFFPDMVNCNITIPFGFVFISFVNGNTLINKVISEKIVNWDLMHKYSRTHNIAEYEDLLHIKDSGHFDIKLGDSTDYILPILRGVEMRKILNVPEALWRVNTFILSITNGDSLIFTRDVLQNYKTDLLLTDRVDNIRDYQTSDGFYLYLRKN